jgi:universal stress protein A
MTIQHIACCTDFSENANIALDTAIELAQRYGAHLSVLHAYPSPINAALRDADIGLMPVLSSDAMRDRIQTHLEEVYGERLESHVNYRFEIHEGHVSTTIVDFLRNRDVDLCVLGAFGLSGMGLVLFGSVAKRVAHRAPCSVMIVRNRHLE